MLKVFAQDKDYENISDYVLECQKKEGEVTMCTVAQALKQEGLNEGLIAGRRDGMIDALCRMINGGLTELFIVGLGYTKGDYDCALEMIKKLKA